MRSAALWFVVACTGPSTSDGDPSPTGDSATAAALSWPHLDCDPLVPEFCGYPFPSNVYTVPAAGRPTGRRVAFGDGLLLGNDSALWDTSDGFSAGTAILAQLPGATAEGFASSAAVADSLLDTSPTLLLDVETGQRVTHFAEVDVRADSDAERSIVIRPMERLRDDARYIVALRGVVDATGAPVTPSDGFLALRDGTASAEPSIEARRDLYENIFTELAGQGWTRAEVQLAWDFSTASDDNNTRWMLHMRDEGLDLVKDGPVYTIDAVDTELDPDHIAFKIEGTVQVPLYMSADFANATMRFDGQGRPTVNADTPWAEVPFEVLIPNASLTSPGRLVQYGHGLFGSLRQIESSHLRSFIDEHNYVMFGVDLQGMASLDANAVGLQLKLGNYAGLRTMFDRLHQGFLNSLVTMRMMKTTFAADATYGSYIDPDHAYYYGISQGGISGVVYMALSQDVERGALGVTGQPYSLLLPRSVDFNPFLEIMDRTWSDAREQQLLIALAQMPWDRVEPTGYSHHVTQNALPGTAPKEVLMRVAIGDHQVTTLGAHIMARSMRATHLTTGLRDVFGLETATATTSGSFYTEYAFGLPEVPDCGVPMDLCEDPHGEVRRNEAARAQLHEFFRDGTGTNHCAGGVCSFPELSGCGPKEDDEAAQALCVLP